MPDDQLITGIRVGRVAGIEVRVSWSILVIGSLVSWSLADSWLPTTVEGRSELAYWGTAVITTVAFFVGLLAHELGHSLVARRRGVDVQSITLWMFGGIAHLERPARSPGDALRIAVAGPIVSIALGCAGLAVAWSTDGLVAAAAVWFGVINLVLAGFNLLPAFPMDGGRVYQAWLWQRHGDEIAATERAVVVGRRIGGVMVALGLLEVLLGALIGGLWLVLIGMFLREASRAELQRVRVARPLEHLVVRDVMSADPVAVQPDAAIAELVASTIAGSRHHAYPVVTAGGRLVGMVDQPAVSRVPRADWHTTTVGDVATPVDRIVVAASTTPVLDLLADLRRDGGHRALVVDDGRLVGIVAPSDIVRLVQLVELTGAAPEARRPLPPPPAAPTRPPSHRRAA